VRFIKKGHNIISTITEVLLVLLSEVELLKFESGGTLEFVSGGTGFVVLPESCFKAFAGLKPLIFS